MMQCHVGRREHRKARLPRRPTGNRQLQLVLVVAFQVEHTCMVQFCKGSPCKPEGFFRTGLPLSHLPAVVSSPRAGGLLARVRLPT